MIKPAEIDTSVGSSAMVLAAGLGKRMHPITLAVPKPLIEVAGKRLIDYAFDHLRAAGVKRAVINVHYHANQLENWAHAREFPEIVVSDERDGLLDTGGGIVKALHHLGPNPFLVLNSDSFWLDGTTSAIERLRRMWDGRKMDSLLLLSPVASSIGYDGTGDFHMDAEGRLTRKDETGPAPFIYAGCFIVSPTLFAGAPNEPFSMNLLWDKVQARGRLFGIRHDGLWIHVGRPESIAYAEEAMKNYMP
jgi:N-acetyl-alpha-D-muramate 1-phosphate uridylyltransferase